MTTFLRLLSDKDKSAALQEAVQALRSGARDERLFTVEPEAFRQVPGASFAYWVSETVRGAFTRLSAVESFALITSGTGTLDDFRFLRCWWEADNTQKWFPFAKGGAFSPTYYDQHLVVGWADDGAEMKSWIVFRYGGGHWARNIRSTEHYFRPGLTWPRRSQRGLGLRAMPAGCIFADKGPSAFVADDDPDELLALLAITNSRAFGLLVSLQMAFGSYEVGVIQQTSVPELNTENCSLLTENARRAWSLKRTLDTITETSHAFLLPAALRTRCGDYDPPAIEAELARIQAGIDAIAFDLYGFSETDRRAATGTVQAQQGTADEDEDDDNEAETPATDGLLSWTVGVAFGRFDWRLATGERQAPPEPDPFDPLPAKSPGMLPDGAQPFHAHAGILVDDPGHPHDLARLVEDVLERVDAPVPGEVRRWLQRGPRLPAGHAGAGAQDPRQDLVGGGRRTLAPCTVQRVRVRSAGGPAGGAPGRTPCACRGAAGHRGCLRPPAHQPQDPRSLHRAGGTHRDRTEPGGPLRRSGRPRRARHLSFRGADLSARGHPGHRRRRYRHDARDTGTTPGFGVARQGGKPGAVGSAARRAGAGRGLSGLRATAARACAFAGGPAGFLPGQSARGGPAATRIRAGGRRCSRSARSDERSDPAGPGALPPSGRAGAGRVRQAAGNLRPAAWPMPRYSTVWWPTA